MFSGTYKSPHAGEAEGTYILTGQKDPAGNSTRQDGLAKFLHQVSSLLQPGQASYSTKALSIGLS